MFREGVASNRQNSYKVLHLLCQFGCGVRSQRSGFEIVGARLSPGPAGQARPAQSRGRWALLVADQRIGRLLLRASARLQLAARPWVEDVVSSHARRALFANRRSLPALQTPTPALRARFDPFIPSPLLLARSRVCPTSCGLVTFCVGWWQQKVACVTSLGLRLGRTTCINDVGWILTQSTAS